MGASIPCGGAAFCKRSSRPYGPGKPSEPGSIHFGWGTDEVSQVREITITIAPQRPDLHVTPDGGFLYGSNRDHDTLAACRIDLVTGRLEFIDWLELDTEPTARSVAIDPTGQFLYAAGQGSGNLAAYRIDSSTGDLARFTTYAVGPVPTCIELVDFD
jgi:hypothetical protein